MYGFDAWLRDEMGAITIDWVALTAGILLLGIMAVYSIFGNGMAPLVKNIGAALASVAGGSSSGLSLAGGGNVPGGSEVLDVGFNSLVVATPSGGRMELAYSGTVQSSQLVGATHSGQRHLPA